MPEIPLSQGGGLTSTAKLRTSARINDQAIRVEQNKMQQFLEVTRNRAAKLEATKLSTEAIGKMKETQAKHQSDWDANSAETYAESADLDYKNIESDTLALSSNNLVRQMMEDSLAKARGSLVGDDMTHIVAAQGRAAGEAAGEQANIQANSVLNGADPNLAIQELEATLVDLQVPGAIAASVRDESANLIWLNEVKGRIDRGDKNTSELKKIEADLKSGAYNDRLKPQQLSQMIEYAQRGQATQTGAIVSSANLLVQDAKLLVKSGDWSAVDVQGMVDHRAALNQTEGNVALKRQLDIQIQAVSELQPFFGAPVAEAISMQQKIGSDFSGAGDPTALAVKSVKMNALDGYIKMAKSNALELSGIVSGQDFEPLDFASEGVTEALTRRRGERDAAAKRFGNDPAKSKLLTIADQEVLAGQFWSADVDTQAGMVAELGRNLSKRELGEFAQALGKGKGYIEAAFMNPRPDYWRQSQTGAGNLTMMDKTVKQDVRLEITTKLMEVIDMPPGDKDKIVNATMAMYASQYSQRDGKLDASESSADDGVVDWAIQQVLGTDVRWGNYNTFIPAKSDGSFMSKDDIGEVRRWVQNEDVDAVAPMYNSAGVKIENPAKLLTSGDLNMTPDGLVLVVDYEAQDGSAIAKNEDGTNYIVDFEALHDRVSNRITQGAHFKGKLNAL